MQRRQRNHGSFSERTAIANQVYKQESSNITGPFHGGTSYTFFKRMFHFDHVMVTTVKRVRFKTHFTVMCFNPARGRFLD